jgi:hypothetical protein
MDSELAEIRQMLDTVKGKAYHQDIGDATLELMQNSQE